jgi:hypothetical protein
MAVPTKWYGLGLKALASGVIVPGTDTFHMLLATHSGYTPDQDAHDYRNDVSGEVANGNGYATGGVATTIAAATYDAATNEVRIGASGSAQWTFSATISCRWAVLCKWRGGASSADELVCYTDLNNGTAADVSIPQGTFTINYDSTGLVKITAS